MTVAENKIVRETQGLLHSCGCKLESAGGNQFRIVKSGSGEILASGSLETCYNTAAYMAGSGQFKPESVVTGPEAYQAGKAMSKKLNQGK